LRLNSQPSIHSESQSRVADIEYHDNNVSHDYSRHNRDNMDVTLGHNDILIADDQNRSRAWSGQSIDFDQRNNYLNDIDMSMDGLMPPPQRIGSISIISNESNDRNDRRSQPYTHRRPEYDESFSLDDLNSRID
jgi:hypothetical protein